MTKQARLKTRQLREERAREARHRRNRARVAAGVGGAVIVGLVVAIVVVVLNAATRSGAPRAATPSATLVVPANATATGAVPVGRAAAPVTVEIYLDYMCPYCGRFDRANGGEITRLVQSGKARFELHPLAFLDRMSAGTRYSTRAANAVATVADRAPASLLAFHTALYGQQPAEGSRGLSDDQIAAIATGSGVPQDVANAFAGGTFEPWVARSTDAAFASGITGTPTVKINGTVFTGDLYTAGPLTQAIEAAGNR